MTVRTVYSEEFKKAAVQKYFTRGNRSLEDLCQEIGVSKSMLWRWVELYKKYDSNIKMKDIIKRPQDWSPDEKIRVFFEYENIAPEEQGAFLRGKGLHSNHLIEWKKICIAALSTKSNIVSRNEFNEANHKIKELERDLLRKDRALAETTALLVLKKKADLIWGPEDKR